MKKFISKCIIFPFFWLIPIMIFLSVGVFFYNNEEFPMWKSKMKLINSKFEYENIIIGDSRAIAGIDPNILGESFYNLALGGSSPLEGFFTLKKIIANGNKPKLIIVSYAPFHLEVSFSFYERAIKYGFYTLENINDIFFHLNKDKEQFWSINYEKLDQKDFYKSLIRAYLIKLKFPHYFKDEMRNSLFSLRISKNMKTYEQICLSKGSFEFKLTKSINGLNKESDNNKFFNYRKIYLSSLENIFTLAEKNNIQVIYTELPFNENSFNHMNSNYLTQYNEFFERLKHKYNNVIFYPDITAYNNSLFIDQSHLNKAGKEKFSNELHKLIKNLPEKKM